MHSCGMENDQKEVTISENFPGDVESMSLDILELFVGNEDALELIDILGMDSG